MNKSFLNLLLEKKLNLIHMAGNKFDVSDMIIEKDFWVCWLLEKLFKLPIKMAFKGGTSLSKVFNLIKRFSEDIDITIDYTNFRQELDLTNTSRSQLKKISNKLKEQLQIYVSETVVPYLHAQLLKIPNTKSFEIVLNDDGERLQFYYPSIVSQQLGYLRDHVLIEFGIRNSTEPCEKHDIVTYLGRVVDNENIILPKPKIDILSPVRTFWEKATLMHVECHRNRFNKNPERLSRHWYDLFMLYNSDIGKQASSSTDILQSVIEHKKAFFNASYTNYDDCLNGKFNLIPSEINQVNLAKDFNKMIQAGMFYESPPKFDEMVKSLRELETTLNKAE
ncbi:MAG: nucleotidyl transferase AbiEii/AbiGii toxin family protein [Gammaproteobacteria bacterium]